MRTVVKFIQIVQQNGDFHVETVSSLTEEDLKFIEWCFAFGQKDFEYMNAVEARYFEANLPRVAPKLLALKAGLPMPVESTEVTKA